MAFTFGPSALTAQMEDSNWIFSFHTQPPPGGIPGTSVHFAPEPIFKTDTFNVSARGSCANIADEHGEMLFFTNGINIYNRDGSIMTNGNYINPGKINDEYAKSGYPVSQGALFLASPGDTSSYHLFHIGVGDTDHYGATGLKFYSSIVRKNGSGGSFYVSEKNQVILSDTLGVCYITATRHANGRDWWLIIPRIASNQYRVYLFDPSGISLKNIQVIGPVTDWRDWSGQSVISPDGSKYIRYDQFNQLNLFDFDRCTGLLSNPIHLAHPFASPDSAVAGGVSVSPNSRYLYLTATTWVYQYDLQATDIASSRILVGEYDGTLLPLPTTFYRGQLAPDGKIYITATNGNRSMHVINHPNLPGPACGFQNNAVIVDNYIFWGSMPYFPNYRLGALAGSGCDTLNKGVAPVAGFEWQVPDTLQPLIVKFMNQSEGAVSWSWDFGDGNVSQDSCPVHNYVQGGIYEVCLRVTNNFGSDSICHAIVLKTSGTLSPADLERLLVYPNPVGRSVTIEYGSIKGLNQRFFLLNTFGQVIKSVVLPNGQTTLQVFLDEIPAGLYWYSIPGLPNTAGKLIIAD